MRARLHSPSVRTAVPARAIFSDLRRFGRGSSGKNVEEAPPCLLGCRDSGPKAMRDYSFGIVTPEGRDRRPGMFTVGTRHVCPATLSVVVSV